MAGLIPLLRHLWLDADDVARILGADTLRQVEAQVGESERRHAGEICVCIEASLPVSYLWRHLRARVPLATIVRERALAQFGKLRVWDTEHNNGVLIYVLLAEHDIEIVADRGLARRVSPTEWQPVVDEMAAQFRAGRYAQGLARAIDAVGAALERHFPPTSGTAERDNALPDRPVIG